MLVRTYSILSSNTNAFKKSTKKMVAIESQVANPAPIAPGAAQSAGTSNNSISAGISGGAAGATAGSAAGPVGSVIGGLIGGAVGYFGNNTKEENDEEQLRQQEALSAQQIQGSEQLTDYQRNSQLQYQRQLYQAQIDGMNAAGLNPAMIYGGSGGGGSTGGSVVTTQGAQAADSAQMENADTNQRGQATNAILQGTQAALNQANIPKVAAEIDNLGAETAKVGQETGNMQIAAIGMNTENQIKGIQLAIAKSTETELESTVSQNLVNLTLQGQKLTAEMAGITINNTTMLGTQQAVIKKYNAEVVDIMAGIAQKMSQTKLNQAEALAIGQKIEQGWQELQIQSKGQEVSQENVKTMANTILKAAGIQAAAQLVTTAANALIKQPTNVNTSQHTTTLDGEGNIRTETYGTTIKH